MIPFISFRFNLEAFKFLLLLTDVRLHLFFLIAPLSKFDSLINIDI